MLFRSSATRLHTQIVPGGNKPPRSVDRTVSASRTTTAAQGNLPRTLRTEEPRGYLGRESSSLHLCPELILCQRATYTNTARRELVSQECLHTCEHRMDKSQSETARSANTRDSQMSKGKHKSISNRNQDYLSSSEPTTVNPGYPNTP